MVQCPTSHAATCSIYSSAWQFKIFFQVLTDMMQKKSQIPDYSLHSLKRQNKREMGEKIPTSSCLGGIQELDREIIL